MSYIRGLKNLVLNSYLIFICNLLTTRFSNSDCIASRLPCYISFQRSPYNLHMFEICVREFKNYTPKGKGTKEDHWRDFWMQETGTGQGVVQLLDSYMLMMIMMC
jgi:hypothetical protein